EPATVEAVGVADLEDAADLLRGAQLPRLDDHLPASRFEHLRQLGLADRPPVRPLSPDAHEQGHVPGARLEGVILDGCRLEARVADPSVHRPLSRALHAVEAVVDAVDAPDRARDLERDGAFGTAHVEDAVGRPKIADPGDCERAARRPEPVRTPARLRLPFGHTNRPG